MTVASNTELSKDQTAYNRLLFNITVQSVQQLGQQSGEQACKAAQTKAWFTTFLLVLHCNWKFL